MEEWRNIEGYEGLYQISNLGRVKSLGNNKTRKEKILNIIKNNNGYVLVNLHKNKVKKTCLLHRLVAKTFLENPNNYPCVNHKDENKENNNINNLEWCTHQYNNTYGTRLERYSESISIPIYCLENNKFYNSTKQASLELDVSKQYICDVLKGRAKQAKGYTFRYANKVLYRS